MNDAGALSTTLTDRIDPARAAALCAVLGLEGAVPEAGSALPPFFHQIYFWDMAAPDKLAADGHPATGGMIPDLGLPRRMWAGGRLTFHAPLKAGVTATRMTALAATRRKTGRSGQLGLVTLRHTVRQAGQAVLTEEQDLIYREAHDRDAEPPEYPISKGEHEERLAISFSEVTLFRYSALTFNGHRIHYDRDYARAVEGYPNLVVHGPLLAQWLMLVANDRLGGLSSFGFRATAPLFQGEEAHICRSGRDYWVEGPDRRLCMTATAG